MQNGAPSTRIHLWLNELKARAILAKHWTQAFSGKTVSAGTSAHLASLFGNRLSRRQLPQLLSVLYTAAALRSCHKLSRAAARCATVLAQTPAALLLACLDARASEQPTRTAGGGRRGCGGCDLDRGGGWWLGRVGVLLISDCDEVKLWCLAIAVCSVEQGIVCLANKIYLCACTKWWSDMLMFSQIGQSVMWSKVCQGLPRSQPCGTMWFSTLPHIQALKWENWNFSSSKSVSEGTKNSFTPESNSIQI